MTVLRSRWQRFWLEWTLATLLGQGAGLVLFGLMVLLLTQFFRPPLWVLGLLLGFSRGLGVGIGQGVALGSQILATTERAVAWVGATSLGWAAAAGASLWLVQQTGNAWLGVGVAGAILGLAQWLVLRQFASRVTVWLWMATWVTAFGLGQLAEQILGNLPENVWAVVALLLVRGVLNGAVTGNNLAWMLQNASEEADPPAPTPGT
ncbi:hypothetical protein [Thermostichus vulcanus]|uniref:Uncharacterized protein n=1 Tax=Thermostichus vulcanus str. 'Rupite' TaxID=2813851 RepID=A0ABT0CAK9_THEVL|nr:hypothetical protein [Thermostichus vulcanus]MCJ2542822.1 hypothetical protein [Thermostichus vulcanus str. 'Rupite']